MSNYDNVERLSAAGILPPGDLDQDARNAINNLTDEEIDQLIIISNKLNSKTTKDSNLMYWYDNS